MRRLRSDGRAQKGSACRRRTDYGGVGCDGGSNAGNCMPDNVPQ